MFLKYRFDLSTCFPSVLVYMSASQCSSAPNCVQVYVLVSVSVSVWMCVGPTV